MTDRDRINANGPIEKALREFDWDDYGMDDVSHAIEEDPDAQEWVPELAEKINLALISEFMPQRYVTGAESSPLPDEVAVQTEPMDMFRQVFESQAYFQGLLGHDYNGMSNEEKVGYLKDQILALNDEAHEALNEIGWKPWASSRHINRGEFAGELADILCFLVNLALGVGLTADDFYLLHQEKAQRNIKRQEEKYDGIQGKCPTCKRAIDDLKAKGLPVGTFGGVEFCSIGCIETHRNQAAVPFFHTPANNQENN